MRTVILKDNGNKDYFTTEAYRTLRTNMQFCGSDVKAVALTSCLPNEGKSTIALELAKSFAEASKKVLLIDADLRRSVMVRKHTTEHGVLGLSQLLSGQAKAEDVVCHTQYEGLDVIFAGKYPPNPVELLSGHSFRELIEEAKRVYDYVFIDTPPLGLVIDCAVVTGVCDSAIMVINSGVISRKDAIDVRDQLQRSGVRILGVVVNHYEEKKKKTNQKGRQQYYTGRSVD